MPTLSKLYDKCLLTEADLNRQKSLNWCWLAVTEAISKRYAPDSKWTQERILLEVARTTRNEHKYGRADDIRNALLDKDGRLKPEWTYQKLTETGSNGFDRRGSIQDALSVTGNLGLTHKIPDGFPVNGRDVFGHIASEIKNGRILVAHMKYNEAVGSSAGVQHAMLIVGVRIQRQIKTLAREVERVYWMNPDPRKPELGKLRDSAFKEFTKLQDIADLVAVTDTQPSLTVAPPSLT